MAVQPTRPISSSRAAGYSVCDNGQDVAPRSFVPVTAAAASLTATGGGKLKLQSVGSVEDWTPRPFTFVRKVSSPIPRMSSRSAGSGSAWRRFAFERMIRYVHTPEVVRGGSSKAKSRTKRPHPKTSPIQRM